MKGNTKLVESVKLKELYPRQQITKGFDKRITRHYSNSSYYLTPDEYTLFNFITFMSDVDCSIKYSTLLLKQYDKSTDRAIEIYGSDKVCYKTSMTNARNSFVSLVEKGLLIRLSVGKNLFMINPYVAFSMHSYFPYKKIHSDYNNIVKSYIGQELSDKLTELCDGIYNLKLKEKEKSGFIRNKNNNEKRI